MMPRFWEYLIAYRDSLAIQFVADPDRPWIEKQLESDPGLLRYQAKPQTLLALTNKPAGDVLGHLWRARIRTTNLEVIHMHDAVVTINNKPWPAYRKKNGTLVDLRLFDPEDSSPVPRLMFRPNILHELGIPEVLIEVAAQSNPPGLILFEDLTQSESRIHPPASQQSTH